MAIGGRKGALYSALTSTGTLVLVGNLRNWEASGTNELIDVTNRDSSGNREFIDGPHNHQATFEALYLSSNATQVAILDSLSTRSARYYAVRFTTSTSPGVAGNGWLQTFSVGGQHEDAALFNGTIQFTGAVTYST